MQVVAKNFHLALNMKAIANNVTIPYTIQTFNFHIPITWFSMKLSSGSTEQLEQTWNQKEMFFNNLGNKAKL